MQPWGVGAGDQNLCGIVCLGREGQGQGAVAGSQSCSRRVVAGVLQSVFLFSSCYSWAVLRAEPFCDRVCSLRAWGVSTGMMTWGMREGKGRAV